MRKVNSKTLALLHDHALRLSENICPTLTDVLDDPAGLLRELVQDSQHDFFEQVLVQHRFWTHLPHGGLVRVDQILPSGTFCCFNERGEVSNTTAQVTASNDFPLWVMSPAENTMIANILTFNDFECKGLIFQRLYKNAIPLTTVDPAETDQLWLLVTITEYTPKGIMDKYYAVRWSQVLNHKNAYTETDAPTEPLLIIAMNQFLFDGSGILSVTHADIIRVRTMVKVSPWLDSPQQQE